MDDKFRDLSCVLPNGKFCWLWRWRFSTDALRNVYRPQTKFARGGGACMVALGGMCVVALGGMHGCSGGACMVALGWHAWLFPGRHVWLLLGGCMVALGGMRGCSGGHVWLLWGGMCGCSGGASVVAPGGDICCCSGLGMCGFLGVCMVFSMRYCQ